MLRLNLFGSASIEASGVPVTGRAAQGRRLALLALLACARGRSLTRDRLIGLLWPDSSTERARRMLSDDVYIARNALGEDALRSIGDELSLDPDIITSDVMLFERLLDEGELESAIALVTGPLLEGFHLSDAAEFERWLDVERAQLGQRYAAALQTLAERSEAQQHFAEAAEWWRKLATHDPYSGRVTLGLMRALEAAGDRAGALRHARVHRALLREEYDTEPDPEVIALAERLRVEPAERAAEPAVLPKPPSAAAATGASEPVDAEPDAGPGAGTGLTPADVLPAGPGIVPASADVTTRPQAASVPDLPSRTRRRAYQAAGTALLLAAVAAGALVVNAQRETASPLATARVHAPSVGVLPFVNMSADPENTYFSDGLTEQIISALSRVDGLQVAARTSSFALRDGRLDVRAIGDTLGVTAVLEGSVRADGRRLRITAQLIDAATGYHIWTEDYDRQIQDVFAVQEDIAAAIAAALELRLTRPDTTAARPAVDLETYDLYLRGLYMRNSLTADALRQAVHYFDRAIARQPDFALAYAAKASVIAPLVLFGHAPFADGVNDYRALTARALELDPASGEAHTALGIQKLFFDWDWDAAGAALERAIELNPNDAHAQHHYANYLRVMGRQADAVAVRERSLELDPLNPRTVILLAGDYTGAGDHERAIAAYERARTLDPAHPLTLAGSGPWLPNTVAWVYLDQGKQREAVADLIRIATLRGATSAELDALRRGFDAAGMAGFWRSWLEMDLRQAGGAADPLRIAKLLVLSGDTARGLDTLDRAFAERNPGLIMQNTERVFRDMRTHPRISRIARAMGLPAVD